MLRRNYFIRVDQYVFLKGLPGNDSEHVRQALDDYKLKKEREKASASSSVKGGGENE